MAWRGVRPENPLKGSDEERHARELVTLKEQVMSPHAISQHQKLNRCRSKREQLKGSKLLYPKARARFGS